MNKRYIILGSLAALLAAGGWYAMNQVKLVEKLEYGVTGYKIISISAEGARIDLDLAVTNNGNLKIKVKKFKFNIFADEKFIATAFSDTLLEINPKEVGTTKVQVLLNPKLLLQNVGSVLQGSSMGMGWKNIVLTMDGGLHVSKGSIPFYVPLELSFKLSEFTEG